MTDAEFEQRKQEQIRALFSAPAQPLTPYTAEEMALIESKCDKEAEAVYLQVVLDDARRRSWQYQKHANIGHKPHISTKLDKQAGISV
ncbi:unnamed protein product [marine sediment metagenome]|uniref:Uncharacterized protein n=1 Tax=marine sediment metagenome TaxID=412755 RepID=X1RY83_9ZZZZ